MDEKELLERLKDPERRNYAFHLLIEKYQKKIYWHVRRMVIDHDDADDITQDTFIRVFRKLDSFREDSQLYTWIYRIATNLCLNHLNRKKRRFFLPIGDISGELMDKIDSDPLISGDEIQKKLHKALLTLPDKQRMVFNMKYFEEMKYEDISNITGTSVGALKASYHLAIKKIEEFLTRD